jgi:magnesium transporter
MISARLYKDGELKDAECDLDSISDHLEDAASRVWMDIEDPTPEDLDIVAREFLLHPLTMEDAKERGQRPKVEIFEKYFSLVAHAVSLGPGNELVDSEIHVFVGKGFLVTLRFAPAFDLKGVIQRLDRQPELTAEGGGFLLYVLLDEIVDGYFDLIERFEDHADDIEDRVFADDPDPDIQEDTFQLKRKVVRFRRLVMPLREVIDMVQEMPAFVTPKLRPYYRDVMDHVIRITEFLDNVRDLLTSALEAQLSQASNRMNQVMKSLTSWGAIILVPTLIAGIYGMNFRNMPELSWNIGYPLALGVMVGAGVALYVVFRRKGWL